MDFAEKLKYARVRAGLTCAQAQEATGIVGSSISNFENNKREPSLSQLQVLASAYHRSLSFFLSEDVVPSETVLWRQRPQENAKELETQFLEYCHRYHNLEIWNNDILESSLPVEKGDPSVYDYEDAELLATRVRKCLGLGDRPGGELLRVLEETCGAKIFHKKFTPTGTAASTKNAEFGMAILLNSENKRWRRNYDLAHELFHLLTWDVFRRDTDGSSSQATSKEEKLADAFASYLLIPSDVFRETIRRFSHGTEVPIEVYFDVARQFDVSVEAAIWCWHRLFNKNRDQVKNTKTIVEKAQALSFLLEQREDDSPPKWPGRYKNLLVEALRNGRISTGRFAEYMEISRREAMEYVEWEAGESEKAQTASA